MTSDDESLDATLNRYLGQAADPSIEQVASSVEAVWEQLRPEAECATLPAGRIVARRSHFKVASAVLVVTMAIGLYAAQRAGLIPVMLHIQQPAPPQVAPASQSPAVSVNPVRDPAMIDAVAGAREPVGLSESRQASPSTAAEAARLQTIGAGSARLQSVGAAFPAVSTPLIDGKYLQSTTATVPLAFQVASIRLIPPPLPTGNGPWTVTDGRFRAERGTFRGVIAWAHEVLPGQVKGGPDWIVRELYDFDASAGNAAAGPDQIRVMLQTLLRERFKLAFHRQTEEAPVYRLVVGKKGSKLQDSPGGQRSYGNWTGPGQITVSESHLLGLVNILSGLLGSPVLDETGLTESYSFRLEFMDPRYPRSSQADTRPDIFRALEEQLGLRLEATRGPVEVIVIDHIERPSPN